VEKGNEAIDVLVRSGMKNQDFCLLLTKHSIVLIREKSRNEIYPGAFGYTSVHIREHDHPSADNIDMAALDVHSIVIPYDRLKSIHFHRGFSSSTMRREYVILLRYLDASRKERRLSAVLTPPPGRTSGNRLDRTEASKYAMEVKGILVEALPDRSVFVADV